METQGRLRWQMALLLALGIVLAYFDRLNISVAAASPDFVNIVGHDPARTGFLLSSYLWSYALLQIPVGGLLDRYGVRRMLGIGALCWAAATFVTGCVTTLPMLILARMVLGVAESPTFPGAAKAVAYWFPRQERGLATSAFDAAAKFSPAIGNVAVAAIMTWGGWRAGFWFTSVLTLVYGLLFLHLYRDPADHPKLSAAEREHIAAGGGQQEAVEPVPLGLALSHLLRFRAVWGLILGFAAYGYSFYLLITWLPGYLADEFHMSMMQTGWYASVPWLVATATDVIIGGWLVDHLIAQGHDSTRVRKTLLTVGMCLGLAVLGAAFTHDPKVAIAWISVGLGGLAFAAPIGWSLPGLLAPKNMIGTLGALMNFANNLMGIIAPIATGYIAARTGSFAAAFGVAGVIILLGIMAFVGLIGRIEQVPELVPEG